MKRFQKAHYLAVLGLCWLCAGAGSVSSSRAGTPTAKRCSMRNLQKGRGAGRNRTDEWRFCRPLPYHLATAPLAKKCHFARRTASHCRCAEA